MEKKRVNIRNAYNTEDYMRDQYNLLREDPDAILDAIGREVKKGTIKSMMDQYLNETDKKKPEDVLLVMKAKLKKFQEDPLGASWINLNMDRDMVYANLIDDEKRRELLDMSVLKDLHNEYLIEKRRKILGRHMKHKPSKRGEDEETAPEMPEAITGSHIRKNLHAFIDLMSQDKAKMQDKNQRKMLQMAIDMNFEIGDKIIKRKTNLEAINYILNFQKEDKKRDIESMEFIYNKTIRKIFLRCCERDQLNNQNTMNFENFLKCLKLLEVHPKHVSYDEAYTLFHTMTQHYSLKSLTLYEFNDIMLRVANIAINQGDSRYQTSMSDDDIDKEKLRDEFYEKYIQGKLHKFTLESEAILQETSVKAYLTTKKELLSFLFNYFIKDEKKSSGEKIISLEEMVLMFKAARIFPTKCDKSKIRYYYEYCQPDDLGLDYTDFTQFLPIIGMDIVERALMAKWIEKIRRKDTFEKTMTRYDTSQFKAPSGLEMIQIFFDSEDFLTGDLDKLKEIIYRQEAPPIESKKFMQSQVGVRLA